jgi:hypothetical protein
MAQILDAPLPVPELLGHAPPDVEAKLGEPLGKGMMRDSCVRYLPQRVWFGCNYAVQRYADKTGNYGAVQVAYEDGRSTAVAYEFDKGEGAFDPIEALRRVGLELPGTPERSEPAADTVLWSWFNARSRLLLDQEQYRVEVSSVGNSWDRAKVEVVLNHPLSDEQQARVKPANPRKEG